MKTTVAVVNSQGADFSLEEIELGDPQADEVLVKIVATGLCHTDIHLKGFLPEEMFPNVFGHEGSGVIEAVGKERHPRRRRRPRGDELRVLRLLPQLHPRQVKPGPTAPRSCTARNFLIPVVDRTSANRSLDANGERLNGNFFVQSSWRRTPSPSPTTASSGLQVRGPARDPAPMGCGIQTGASCVLSTCLTRHRPAPRSPSSAAVLRRSGRPHGRQVRRHDVTITPSTL